MGYYNPLPWLVGFGYDAAPYVMLIDNMIKQAILDTTTAYPTASIDYIDTLGTINGILGYTGTFPFYTYNYTFGHNYPYIFPYLYADITVPIADIHLTEEGYLRVAESFTDAIEEDFNFIP